MTKAPDDHMSGINALPKATSAWQQARLNAEAARGLYGGKRWSGSQWADASNKPVEWPKAAPSPFGKTGTLSREIDASLKANAPKGHSHARKHADYLEAEIDSTCFSDLFWDSVGGGDGIVTAIFARNGAVYQYELTREEFLEWIDSDSLGQYFNDEIR